jgi:hypothetical protein
MADRHPKQNQSNFVDRAIRAFITLICMVVVGCAQMVWQKPGGTEAELDRDLAICEKTEAFYRGSRGTNTPYTFNHAVDQCLTAYGWTRIDKSNI